MPKVKTTKKSQLIAKKGIRPASQKAVPAAEKSMQIVSDPTRLSILYLLIDGECDLVALSKKVGQSLTGLRQNLALLRRSKFIILRRAGKRTYCSLTPRGLRLTPRGRMLARVVDEFGSLKTAKPVTQKESKFVPLKTAKPVTQKESKIGSALLEVVGAFVDDPEEWFRTANEAFEGRRPIDLLGTADEERLRNRIEAAKLGFFS
jgi:DNA-binding transcriptional ArsR family regulator